MKSWKSWSDYLTINSYWFGLTVIAQTITPLIAPLLVQEFAGETVKGTYYGILRFGTLMIAVLVQSFMGYISDQSTSAFGRRRPFILIGTLFSLAVLAGIAFTANLSGMKGYWVLFVLLIFLSIASNTGQAAQQGFLNDLIPVEKRGRYSGVKALFEIPIPILFIALTVARFVGKGEISLGLLIAGIGVFLSMVLSMFVSEKAQLPNYLKADWKPFFNLAVMTAIFALVILSSGFFVRKSINLISGIGSAPILLILTGLTGLAGMVLAVVVGVWGSIHAGLGQSGVKHSGFIWWVTSRLAFLLGVNNLGSFAVYFLQGRLGYIREEAVSPAANLLTVVGIFILITAFPSGWLSDRFGPRPLVYSAGILAAFGTLVILSYPSMTIIYIGGSLIGAATGLFYSANWALGTQLVPADEAGRFLGIANLAGAGAGAIGAFIGGAMADQVATIFPEQPGAGYVLLFAIYGIMFVVSVVTLQFIGRVPAVIAKAPQGKA
jgi:MFS family permease